MVNIESGNIKVFPSVRRSDESDLDARLPSEYNLTNIVNRLTNTDSFIVEGLTIVKNLDGAIQLTSGSCNIHGYYFEIKNSIILNDIGNHDKVYLKIETETSAVNSFVELVGNDESNNVYTGLQIVYRKPETGYYLLLATKDGNGNWINNTQASIRYTSEMVEIPTIKEDTQEIYSVWKLFSNPTNQSDLRLNNLIMNLGNLIIDDGDLDQN